ncbi:MAG: hypothetical protein LBH06_07495 [Rikenellaceae bacterium]|nr:hypothetical protein [Rikenellaceae bacterium]
MKENRVKYLELLNGCMINYGMDTPLRQAAFIAQIGHESASLEHVREIASGAAYDTGRLAASLGNTEAKDGDGQKYKGRGLLQVTGKSNYVKCSRALFDDDRLLDEPHLLEQPRWAVESACWYWWMKGLNELADRQEFVLITRKINGGTNGLKDRTAIYERAKKVLGAVPA